MRTQGRTVVEGFEALQRMYREQLPERCRALDAEWRAVLGGAPAEAHAQVLRRVLHNLSGSGGAYGFEAMGEMARNLEKRWVQWLNLPAGERPDALQLCVELAPLMRTLQDLMHAASLPLEGDA
jgi:HPt (histidine-containing phosphotransfer) domain-containing protein